MKSLVSVALTLLSFVSQDVQAFPAADNNWPTTSCTFKNIRVRKEWGDLSKPERKSYTDAVKCLIKAPSKLNQLDPVKYVGVKTRYDDFVATHINYTLNVHLDGIFLSWHRNYIWLFESALRNECGYQGAQPYWDYTKFNGNMKASPVFDGSEYSMSGDGAPMGDAPYVLGPNLTYPHGTGGGCIMSGPFQGTTINLGPFDFTTIFTNPGVLPANAFSYNPRCLTRDLNDYANARLCNQDKIDYLLSQKTIAGFQNTLSVPPGATLEIGAHPGSHLSVGADGYDFFSSPNDPVFVLLHAQADRLWLEWQLKDPYSRVYGDNALSGGSTTINIPPSPNVTMSYVQSWGILDQVHKTMDLMSPLAGPFCYIYV